MFFFVVSIVCNVLFPEYLFLFLYFFVYVCFVVLEVGLKGFVSCVSSFYHVSYVFWQKFV